VTRFVKLANRMFVQEARAPLGREPSAEVRHLPLLEHHVGAHLVLGEPGDGSIR